MMHFDENSDFIIIGWFFWEGIGMAAVQSFQFSVQSFCKSRKELVVLLLCMH